ncbi:MAG: ABC transporter substrate-binding protein [Deltaproteobacteria bacterium]|nr:ABC transporter substrate-binding protein [Candidatus Zymogenaceae bacterium]
MKRIALLAAALMFVSCISALPGAEAKEKTKILIGITQIVEHPSLDDIRKGFIDYLSENGYKEGVNVTYDINIAQGDMAAAALIADKLVGMNPDLILSITTPSSQPLVNATDTVPILFAAVTDPVGAGLVSSLEGGGKNVTGTSDLTPVGRHFDLIREIAPGAKKIGIIYNAGEANSVSYINWAKKEADRLGMELIEATVTSSGDVLGAAESLVGKVDVIHIPTDNTVTSAFESVTKVCEDNRIPLFASSVLSVQRGALAAVAIDPYRLGRQTGEMAIEILKGKNPGDMPVEYLKKFLLYVSLPAAKKYGVTIPEEVIKRADVVIK